MARIACSKPLAAFLDLVALSEGTSNSPNTHDDGYDIIVSGVNGPNTFSDYSIHPFASGRPPIEVRIGPPPLLSTASGRYQITLPTWLYISKREGLGTFSPQNQDLAALALLKQCGASALIASGKFDPAIEAACMTWASFPGSDYGQGGHTLSWLQTEYETLLSQQA